MLHLADIVMEEGCFRSSTGWQEGLGFGRHIAERRTRMGSTAQLDRPVYVPKLKQDIVEVELAMK